VTTTRVRSIAARIVTTFVILLGVQVACSSAASAYNWSNSGSTGGVTPYQVVGTHFSVPCGYGYSGCFQPGVILQGPSVSRSPKTTGAQIVYVVYTVYRYSNGWYAESTETLQQTIPAGYNGSIRFANRNWLLNTGGSKYVTFGVGWVDQRTGTVLGTRQIYMNQQGDYVCNTRFTLQCSAGPGYVSVYQP
jgi:hypothetical protein